MQTACRIDNNHVHILGSGGLNAVIHHGRRIGTFVLADNGGTAALCPDFQLVSCGSTEGIGSNQQDFLSLAGELLGNLADGGGLADTVDTHHQNHGRIGGQVQRGIANGQHVCQNVLQRFSRLFRCLQAIVADPLAQLTHCPDSSIHAQICQNQAFFQFIKKIIVNFTGSKDIAQCVAESFPGLGQTCLDFIKKSHSYSFILQYPDTAPSDSDPGAAVWKHPVPAW